MKVSYLRHNEANDKLILIFAGWGSDPRMYADAVREGWDTLVAYDYDDFEFPLPILAHYRTIYLFAWSLGVFAAEQSLNGVSLAAAVAVNGTCNPVSDTEGIPVATYQATTETLSLPNLAKFRLRMAGDRTAYAELVTRLPDNPDVEALKSQLHAVAARCHCSLQNSLTWTRVYIGENDRIFPPANQSRFWSGHVSAPEVYHIDAPHFIDIAEIVRAVIPNLVKVGERFRKAAPTYDLNASAQHAIASRLAAMVREVCGDKSEGDVVEIGAGTGYFSRCYVPLVRPRSMTYIDLYPLCEFNLAGRETYVVGDAEQWFQNAPSESLDIITSASAIQWFSHPDRFFENAARSLRPGGVMVCSSFLPGNLSELDALRPSPMMYVSEAKLTAMLRRHFSRVEVTSEPIVVPFSNSRELIMHLKHTGVGGSASTGRQGSSISRALGNTDTPLTLTYRPVYITAHK